MTALPRVVRPILLLSPRPSSSRVVEPEPYDRAIAEEPSVAPEICRLCQRGVEDSSGQASARPFVLPAFSTPWSRHHRCCLEERSVDAKRPITWLWKKAIDQLDDALHHGAGYKMRHPPDGGAAFHSGLLFSGAVVATASTPWGGLQVFSCDGEREREREREVQLR